MNTVSKYIRSAYIAISLMVHIADRKCLIRMKSKLSQMRKFIAVSILFVMSSGFSKAQNKMLIAAASDLKFTLDSLIFVFSKTHNGKVDVTYGSSGKLTEQIVNGAPFDLFFSADIFYPERLKHEKKTSSEIYHYATGKIVIWSKKIDPNKLGMKSLLDPAIKKVAIANPLHAPYGKRAIESLAYFKMSEILKSKLVYGENISQTAQFISTGAADVGIIALSLALSPNMKREKGSYFVIPAGSHEPLIQGAVVTTHGRNNELAAVFFDFLKTADAAAILSHYGFSHSNTDQN